MATPPPRTPPPGTPSSGQAVPLPAEYRALNTAADPNAGIKKYVDDYYQKTGILPQAFKVENGHAVEQEPGFLFRHPWLFPVIGITAGLILAPVVGGVTGGAVTGGAGAAGGTGEAVYDGAGVVTNAANVPPEVSRGASSVPWGTIVGAGTQLFGNLFAANLQASSADRAAEIAAAGNKYSADLLAKANADSLKFQYDNAENAFQNNEASRKGNYGIFAARERRLGSIGDEVGLGPREIPDYVPGVDPLFGGGPAGQGGRGASPAANMPRDGEVDWSAAPDQLGAQLTKYYQTRGVPASEVPYWVSKAGELVARGKEINNPNYANERLAASNIFGGGATTAPTTQPITTQPVPRTASRLPYMTPTIAPGVVPQSIGYYA